MRLNSGSEMIYFYGHPNILSLHRNTIEVTKDSEISKRADCIIGVRATKACADFNDYLKRHIQSGGALRFEIRVKNEKFEFIGKGNQDLDLTDEHELVLRKSNFSSHRTGGVMCSAAAVDIPRSLIDKLKSRTSVGALIISPIVLNANDE
jgi:hypothetical protein